MTKSWAFAGWFYKRGEQRLGPFSTAEFRQLLAAGELQLTDKVWRKWVRETDSKWSATDIPAVLDPSAPEAPPCASATESSRAS